MKPKKEKSKKKSKSSKHRKDKSLYEVAEGVTTPSKEHLSGTATPTNVMVSQLICLSLMVFVHCQQGFSESLLSRSTFLGKRNKNSSKRQPFCGSLFP